MIGRDDEPVRRPRAQSLATVLVIESMDAAFFDSCDNEHHFAEHEHGEGFESGQEPVDGSPNQWNLTVRDRGDYLINMMEHWHNAATW